MRVVTLALLLAWAQSAGAADWPRFRGDAAMTGVAADALPPALKLLWSVEIGESVESSAAIVGDRVLIGSYDGHVYALNRDGTLAWKARTEGPVHSTPAVREGVAYVAGCDEMLRGFRITDGREVFATPSGAYTAASPAMHGGRAIYGTFANEVLAVDLASRKIVWRYTHPDRKFPFYSSAAVADGRVFLGGRDKLLHALDAGTGTAVWTLSTRARIDSSPAVSGGRVYVGSSDGKLYVVDATSGKTVFEFEAGGPLA